MACGSFLTALSREDRAVLGVHTLRSRIWQHPGIEMVLYVVAHFHGWVVPEGECILHFPYQVLPNRKKRHDNGRAVHIYSPREPAAHLRAGHQQAEAKSFSFAPCCTGAWPPSHSSTRHATPRLHVRIKASGVPRTAGEVRCARRFFPAQPGQEVYFFGRVPGVVLGAGCRLVGWGVLLSGLGYLYPIYFQLCM